MVVFAGQKALADDINAALASCIGGEIRSSDTSAINTTETVWATTGSSDLSLAASSTYEIHFRAAFTVTDGTGQFVYRIRDDNVSGSIRLQSTAPNGLASLPLEFSGSFLWTTSTATTKKWVVSVIRVGGAGNVTVFAGSFLKATYLAPSGRIATI